MAFPEGIQISVDEALNRLHLAKSRRTNSLNPSERQALVKGLEEVFGPVLEELEELKAAQQDVDLPAPEGEEEEPPWLGEDKENEIEIRGEYKGEVLDAWKEHFEIPEDAKILTARVGNAWFYSFPKAEDEIYNLWVRKVA